MAKGKYQEWLTLEGLTKIEGWARDGLSEEQIAHNMGITRPTLWKWKENHNNIFNALKRGKEVVDKEVENSLFKAAKGYYVDETKEIMEKDEDGQYTKLRVEKTKKWIAANTTAQIFWLKNRKPSEWRDKQEIDNNIKTGNFKVIIDGEELADE